MYKVFTRNSIYWITLAGRVLRIDAKEGEELRPVHAEILHERNQVYNKLEDLRKGGRLMGNNWMSSTVQDVEIV